MILSISVAGTANNVWHYQEQSSVSDIPNINGLLCFQRIISMNSHCKIILLLGIQQKHSVKVLQSRRRETKIRDC